jgi:hypothetical protein
MPINRQIQVGDLYYLESMRRVFEVVGPHPKESLAWIMATADDEHTTIMAPRYMDRGNWRYTLATGPDFKVVPGSTWYTHDYDELFIVVKSNDSREAGADSWEMRGLDSCKTLYMHHNRRMRGEWLHVSDADTLESIPVVRRSRYHRDPVI